MKENKRNTNLNVYISVWICVWVCECMPYAQSEVKWRENCLCLFCFLKMFDPNSMRAPNTFYSLHLAHTRWNRSLIGEVVLDHIWIVYAAAAAIFLNEISIFSSKQQQRWKRQACWITETDTYIIICKTLQLGRTCSITIASGNCSIIIETHSIYAYD